ncbi:hypothetical protein H9X85_01760 [Anaerotignum lactatifermentans]|uniref:CarD-like/TRCF RNAP-interacting domain-containing protein n=1 Tax=Anaerotignum lactatifermentans TaxID=160404 RepID=A0ABS2G9C2_9FIRM|nr:hypothetical protein [Anaerotignum lactatifermentans]MBM6828355.1 hypothetical protein [Anaerotignum lactatifermentans]MBM6877635.1 hypothetical protein [Anaerotignum lactatifermentans]MBM6949938.1 hypothetical protein [Anaerotignum lactatifermentans]
MFLAGETIFYPLHGIGTVVGIAEDGSYQIHLAEENVNIKVSQKGAAAIGLRYPLTKGDFFQQLEAGKTAQIPQEKPWRQQRKENAESLKSGEIKQVASVLRRLEEKERKKPLSASEIRMKRLARQIIQSEIRFILDIDEKKAKELLANFMNY